MSCIWLVNCLLKNSMKCVVSAPFETKAYDNLVSITLTTKTGLVQIKKGHAEYFVSHISGDVVCLNKSQESIIIPVREAICRVVDNVVTVVV